MYKSQTPGGLKLFVVDYAQLLRSQAKGRYEQITEISIALKELSGQLNIPVIALSSDAFPKHIENGLEAGFFRYLTKPYKLNDLTSAIDAALAFSQENYPSA